LPLRIELAITLTSLSPQGWARRRGGGFPSLRRKCGAHHTDFDGKGQRAAKAAEGRFWAAGAKKG
jgi:hypothetical protein